MKPHDLQTEDNRLVWLDLAYGRGGGRKTLGGAVGRVTLRLRQPAFAEALVLGQYVRVGESTRFGFGKYRIEELGPPPCLCRRSQSLLELALSSTALDSAAAFYHVPSGRVRHLAMAIRDGRYAPQAVSRFLIGNEPPRLLAVPVAEDRALQRAVLLTIAPALDLFFQESSLAYRHGLGRKRAAYRIRAAYGDGFRWAVRADFHAFFDSIEHRLLQDRLDAYLADDDLVRLIMTWVQAGAPQQGRGLPTGSPLSPLLSNLFLDQFDERLSHEQARLVRYADDFLILFRQPEQAERLFRTAEQLATELQLRLNADKTQRVDLAQPFDFLGFRFHRDGDWQFTSHGQPVALDDLGWSQVPKTRDQKSRTGNDL